jgi:release factor glutamine methyltransferase
LEVDQAVLIPRPETEILVDEVLQWVADNELKEPMALDIGTGSGAIALSLVHEGPFSRVVATDTSRIALEVATRNSLISGLSDRVDFRFGEYYHPLTAGEMFEVIVSNPPYIADGEAQHLDPEIREWEPGAALYAGPDGLAALRRIATGAGPYLKPGGLLALEVGLGQAAYIMEILENTGEFVTVRVRRDLTGRERIVLAHRVMND